jgi:DNA-binding NarL/FixJ family response regulator
MPKIEESKRQKVLRLYKIGWSIRDIANECATTQDWVKMWINEFKP